jgi:peptidoglycan/LPS O-acetylase OafA/YrhL
MKMIVTAATILLAVCTVLCCVYSGSIPITPIPFYIIAYGMGRLWDTEKDQPRRTALVLSIGVVAFVVRFVLRNWYDGTIFYDRVIAPYTHYVAAFSFFVASARIFNKKPGRITHFISDISFEIYLYHYMFLWPPFSLMHITNSWILNSAIAIAATLITAWFMHIINNMVQRIAEKSLCFRKSKS